MPHFNINAIWFSKESYRPNLGPGPHKHTYYHYIPG